MAAAVFRAAAGAGAGAGAAQYGIAERTRLADTDRITTGNDLLLTRRRYAVYIDDFVVVGLDADGVLAAQDEYIGAMSAAEAMFPAPTSTCVVTGGASAIVAVVVAGALFPPRASVTTSVTV